MARIKVEPSIAGLPSRFASANFWSRNPATEEWRMIQSGVLEGLPSLPVLRVVGLGIVLTIIGEDLKIVKPLSFLPEPMPMAYVSRRK